MVGLTMTWYSEKNDDFQYMHTWFNAKFAQKNLEWYLLTILCHRQYVLCCANLFKLQFKKTGLIIDIFLSLLFFQIQTCP